ncbi:hypothetical protein VC83_00681 [Pseudogymnoascus destructans]|uniref:Myb-like DNA-binding domain-containing protein n=2 Tax=Pseudogymnoascus destructans TaxID=655981 RepID=L8FV39_PSED2|nr:uncharacterized protein VC83_00681 [Pseudogymnoascus destructans]ELR04742.1 hypothetical protein GMDG_06971 [Pseudogymnoascus destructans 20631-21]OAF62794.1 hypothetical protein VC83_00681 [Pseudogymnoascus destructans]
MPSEAQMAKFMYYIVKQLDVRSVDWNLVASDMEITNGHAARMRFARFKNQMEGTVPKARAPRDKSRAPKAKRVKTKDEKKEEDGGEKALLKLKLEEGATADSAPTSGGPADQAPVRSPAVKPEPADDVMLGDEDAPGEDVHESEIPKQTAHVSATPSHSPPNSTIPTPSHPLTTPTHLQESLYHQLLPQPRRPSVNFSPASSFTFSAHEMMSSQGSMFMQSMEGVGSQDMGMASTSAFYDPFMFVSPQPQQQQTLLDAQGRLVKGELQWDTSFC